MRAFILGAALVGVCVWGYLQTKKLSDSGIEAFYHADADTTGRHDADAACAMIADDFHADVTGTVNGRSFHKQVVSKADYCATQKDFFTRIEGLEKVMGRSSAVDYNVRFGNQVYAPDHRSATIQVNYDYSLLDGKLMHNTGNRVDTLAKVNGKVLLVAIEDHASGTVGAGR